MQTEGERISIIISNFCESKAEFARLMEEKPQTVSNWVSRGAGKVVLNKILSKFPKVNTNWLLTGDGEMLNENIGNDISSSPEFTTYLLPLSAMGGSLTGFTEGCATLQNCESIVSPIANVDFAITVYGDSMAPEYPSGSRILIKKINPDLFIDWGKVYVLDTSNGTVVKEVRRSEKKGHIACYSINPDPKYAPFDIALDEIYGVYKVLICMAMK